MADLQALIRLRRHTVEEKQKVLADIYRQVESFENRKAELLARLDKERKALDEDITLEARAYYGRFEGVIRKDVDRLNGQIKKLETRLQIAQEDVRSAFADMKRVEIVHERRQAEEKQEIDNKESQELDEIGLEGFRRSGEE
jgi:flagellar export protein FliJ